jgi:ribose 5-phosphate isomerase A
MSDAVVRAKAAAAERAAAEVRDGMLLGLGSGSTSELAIDALGARIRDEGLRVTGVPTSERTAARARAVGIPLVELTADLPIDRTIDGADEVDPRGNLIKGGGGALLREKLVAIASRERVIICDHRKRLPYLGAFPLPVIVVPFGWPAAQRRLEALGHPATLRRIADEPLITDDGLYVLDLACGRIDDPAALEAAVNAIPGVVEVGLFVGLTTRVLYGFPDGQVEEWAPAGR